MNSNQTSRKRRRLDRLVAGFAWLLSGCITLWALAALYFDLSFLRPPILTPVIYLAIIASPAYLAKARLLRMAIFLGGFLVVVICWLSLKPSNHRPWQANVSQT